MSATDDCLIVGDPLPKVAAVAARDGFKVAVSWKDAGGGAVEIDLAPDIFTFKAYAPLRSDRALFEAVRVIDDGAAIAWGTGDSPMEMPALALERLADEAMEESDLRALMRALKLTRDGLAAQLGISRRLVGYYLEGQTIPRYIALACAGLRARAGETVGSP